MKYQTMDDTTGEIYTVSVFVCVHCDEDSERDNRAIPVCPICGGRLCPCCGPDDCPAG